MIDQFDLIVFDWDGTLMDSTSRIVSSMQAAAQLSGLPKPSAADVAGVIGLSLDEAFSVLFARQNLAEEQRIRLMDHYRQQFIFDNDAPMPMFVGAVDLVKTLYAKGKWLAVATGKSRRGLQRAFAESGLASCFHGSICADEALSKPDPDMLQQLMREFSVPPERTLMVGDTDYDLGMAKRAGVAGIGVTYGAQPRERLCQHSALALVGSINELSALLFSQDQALSLA